jgi:cell wall-associated NlpC family hydrolase
VARADVQPGDLMVWSVFHMGIAIDGKQMISARDPAQGTGTGDIDGGGTGPLTCCRPGARPAGGMSKTAALARRP